MQFLNLSKTRHTASAVWKSLVGTPESDLDYEPYERELVQRSEITAMFDLNYRTDNAQGYSPTEQREHDNLTTMRDILYPANHA